MTTSTGVFSNGMMCGEVIWQRVVLCYGSVVLWTDNEVCGEI